MIIARPLMAVRQLIDIGVNLTDKVFCGIYRGKQCHTNDFGRVLSRATESGLNKMIISAGSLSESIEAIALTEKYEMLYSTVGCHPTRCLEFDTNPDLYYSDLKKLILSSPKVVAVGECGLDFDREQFCPRDVQIKYFELQLKLANEVKLPLFFHCRAAHDVFLHTLTSAISTYFSDTTLRGVVHTYDGNMDTAQKLIDLGLYLGVNGCSLKTDAQLSVVKSLPLDRLLLETDAPWCEIRPTHASYKYVKTRPTYRKPCQWEESYMVKGRNEPANVVQVLEVVAALHGISEDILADIVYKNTTTLFNFSLP